MSFTLRQLRYFSAAAEFGCISRAALQLHISQSAVTAAIRDLEGILQQRLFDRHPQGVELTRSGRAFLGHARQILDAAEDALHMRDREKRITGTLSVAASYTVIGYFLPHHLQRFSARHPHVRLKLHEVHREGIEQGLLDGHYDVGMLLASNVDRIDVNVETLFGSQRRLWVPARHPLLDQPEVSLSEVSSQPYIMLTVDEAAESAMKYWAQTPLRPDVRLRTSSVEAARSMVANGLGVTILSDMVYRPWSLEGKRIETINLKDSVPSMNIGIGWRQGSALSPAAAAFREYFRQNLVPELRPRASTG